MHDEKSLRDIAKDTVGHLSTLRDEIKLRLHLANMDARDAWHDAEPHLTRAEKRLRDVLESVAPGTSEQVKLELHLGLAEARDKLASVEPKVRALGDAFTDAGRKAVDTLKANLARLQTPPD